jgi:hypothetical protein
MAPRLTIALPVMNTCFLLLLLAGMTMTMAYWGSGQEFHPEVIGARLSRGMTLSEAEYALGLPPERLVEGLLEQSNDESVAILSDTGLGRFFVPQFHIALIFDQNEQLDRCVAEIQWRIDEITYPVAMKDRIH